MEMLVTAEEMREMDRQTIEDVHLPGLLLMEHAGMAVADMAVEMLDEVDGDTISIFCGKGNNGGDGFVTARILFQQGWMVTVFLVGNPEDLGGDAQINFNAVQALGINIVLLNSEKDLPNIDSADLIIDALLGTGIRGEVTGFVALLMDWINQSPIQVLSVDVPSGLHCDNGQFEGACIEADATVTFGELKRGLVVPPGRDLAGLVDIAEIGIPYQVADSINVKTWLVEDSDCLVRLPSRPVSAHKGDFGKLLVLAGSRGLTGAAALTSMAALRTGSGLVVLGCPAGSNSILESKLTEVMTQPLSETEQGSLSLSAEGEIQSQLEWADVLAIGPGLSQHSETQTLIRKIVMDCELPMVIDADGLNAFTDQPGSFKKKKGPFILTPHPGELARLTHLEMGDIESDPIEIARKWACEWQCVLVLKGAPTVIGHPDGHVYVNSTGNSGMATAGSGDVLTGIIAGLLAQGCSVQDASICGVYLHGLAGDLVIEDDSDRALIASDITETLGMAFQSLEVCL
ncbi:NAD(P)H-hydrate dehydratase [bacterium]